MHLRWNFKDSQIRVWSAPNEQLGLSRTGFLGCAGSSATNTRLKRGLSSTTAGPRPLKALHVSLLRDWSVLKERAYICPWRCRRFSVSGRTEALFRAMRPSAEAELRFLEAICKTYPRWGRTRQTPAKVMGCKIGRERDERRLRSECLKNELALSPSHR